MNQFNMRQPFIIAEMSGNHNQSLNRALEIVDLAAEAGVDALKIQTYTADTMTIDKNDGEFFIEDKRSLWKGESLYSLYQKAYTPWEWHQAIFQRCKEKGIIGFSTPFDFSSVDFLEELDVPFYKIASFENVDLPLIKKVAQTGKPIIASTGMASLAELGELVSTARENGCMDLVFHDLLFHILKVHPPDAFFVLFQRTVDDMVAIIIQCAGKSYVSRCMDKDIILSLIHI